MSYFNTQGVEQCAGRASQQFNQTRASSSLARVQTKNKIELMPIQHFSHGRFAFYKLAFATVPIQALFIREKQPGTVAYEKNSDPARIVHRSPEATDKRQPFDISRLRPAARHAPYQTQ